MPWQQRLNGDSLAWLLEPDAANPAIRYYALRDLLDLLVDAPDVVTAQAAVMQSGPVPAILDAQEPDGYWQQPGGGYGKYRGTAWQIILLGDLGADPTDVRVRLRTVALNRLDLWTVGGLPGIAITPPWVLGADGCGDIESVGAEVSNGTLAVGDRVVINPGISCSARRISCRPSSASARSLTLKSPASLRPAALAALALIVVISVSRCFRVP